MFIKRLQTRKPAFFVITKWLWSAPLNNRSLLQPSQPLILKGPFFMLASKLGGSTLIHNEAYHHDPTSPSQSSWSQFKQINKINSNLWDGKKNNIPMELYFGSLAAILYFHQLLCWLTQGRKNKVMGEMWVFSSSHQNHLKVSTPMIQRSFLLTWETGREKKLAKLLDWQCYCVDLPARKCRVFMHLPLSLKDLNHKLQST